MSRAVWTGVVPMSPERYAMLARLAGSWLEEPRPWSVRIGTDSGRERRAVYVAVTAEGLACYCGRTRPRSALRAGAAALRIRRHCRENASKREEWAAYWVIPLVAEVPEAEVDRLERAVAARLGLPLRHRHRRRGG
ncbi:hypothetical protein ACFQVC_38110 [Streptomyces monticola]|uniref:GIY-YIG nuclease family protein n=1 Tax=Streptomyces monticola TaxID=2666263 RepID=A0ABW2JV16_9ACTN